MVGIFDARTIQVCQYSSGGALKHVTAITQSRFLNFSEVNNMTKEVSPLDQVLIDTIQKVTNVSGEVYDGAKAVTEKSIDFAMQQAPEVVHQLLLYKLVESLAFFILGILLIVASGIFLVYGLRKYASSEWNDVHSPALMFLVLPTGAGFMTAATNIDWLKIWLAPKVYLIEYAANLLR